MDWVALLGKAVVKFLCNHRDYQMTKAKSNDCDSCPFTYHGVLVSITENVGHSSVSLAAVGWRPTASRKSEYHLKTKVK